MQLNVEKYQPDCLAIKLPPKILISICSLNAPLCNWNKFIYTSDAVKNDPADRDLRDDEDESAPPVSKNHICDTINASHVCRNWRASLLSAPELWCRMIDPYNPSMSKTMLERSQSFGISFSLPSHKENDGRDEEDFEREITRQYVDRLKEFQFKCRFSLDLSQQSNYLRGSMNAHYFPVLEDLSISFPTFSELPHKFPGVGMPKLKRLHLHRCFFQDGSRFSALDQTLVRLHIDNSSLTEDSLVNALRALPHLQALILNEAFDQTAETPAELCSDNFLCLSHLQELRITDVHSSRAASFLGCITTTQVLSIFCLEIYYPASQREEPPDPPALNVRLFHQLSWILLGMTALKPLSSLEVACRRGVTFCDDANAMLSDVSPLSSHLAPTPERCFHVRFTSTHPFAHNDYLLGIVWFLRGSKKTFVDKFFSTIGNLGVYAQVRHLAIPGYREDVNENVAAQILRQCRGVTVFEDVTLFLWELLCEMDDLDISENSKNFVLPDLEEISFDSLDVTLKPQSIYRFDDETESNHSDEEMTGACWLASSISSDDKSYVEKDDPDYDYESGNSNWEDEPDTFIEDLVEFCKRRKSIHIIRFFQVADDLLAECKKQLGPLGVDIIYQD